MRLILDLGRRNRRSTLTIRGIPIGIMALGVFGSMANKIDFNRERGQTIGLVTHDAEVGAACDRVVRLRDGLRRPSGEASGMVGSAR